MAKPIIEIDLDRLENNYLNIKKMIGNNSLLAVVKADAYGHGVIPISKKLESLGINFFAVFTIDEAIELRKNGINADIIIFERLSRESYKLAIKYNIIVNVSWFSDLEIFLENMIKKQNFPKYHLKIDTGMTRLGIPYESSFEFLNNFIEKTNLIPDGIYTHLATADEGDLSFAINQKEKFDNILSIIKNKIDLKWVHISNSGGVSNLDNSNYNLVRVGMLLYGALPSNSLKKVPQIQPVMNFKGEIVLIRRVKKDIPISYGGLYKTAKSSNIGVIQVGFADGMPRAWFERGYVNWNGKKYKICGRICMDQFMVNFENDKPSEGEKVLIWGKDNQNHIPVEIIAEDIGLNPYNLFTSISDKRATKIIK